MKTTRRRARRPRCPACRGQHDGGCPILRPLLLDPDARAHVERLLSVHPAFEAAPPTWRGLPRPRAAA